MELIAKNCICFFKKETILCVATVLALISACFVPPSTAYISYVDWDTLALLFSLMAVMKGFQKAGLFSYLGNLLLQRTSTTRGMMLVLVFLPFIFSMFITNDVALITFVPFALVVLKMSGQKKLLVPLVVLQTVAANLGSMLTPMGNPQNLYLYARSGMSFGQICFLMAPYVLISGVCIAILIILRKSVPVGAVSVSAMPLDKKVLFCSGIGFAICITGILDIIPPLSVAAAAFLFLMAADRQILMDIDYSLLGTFLAFFIFIGNIGCLDGFRQLFSSALSGHAELAAVAASQFISNVPAALLLSGFTTQWSALIVGCNIGGLGTMIASMASLISYKMVSREYPDHNRKYFIWFTACNLCLLVILLSLSFIIP